MGLFRRRQGKHALGAAVTSVPSGPLRGVDVTPPPVAAAPPPAPAAPAPPDVEAAEPDLMTSISALIASGEAWAGPPDGSPRAADPAGPLPAAPVAVAPSAPVPAAPEPPRPVAPAHVAPAPSSVLRPLLAAQRPLPTAPSPRSALEAALAGLKGAHGEPVAGTGPRVQLGFRDGTSTTLDPTSSQSLALEQLAQSLTRRD